MKCSFPCQTSARDEGLLERKERKKKTHQPDQRVTAPSETAETSRRRANGGINQDQMFVINFLKVRSFPQDEGWKRVRSCRVRRHSHERREETIGYVLRQVC